MEKSKIQKFVEGLANSELTDSQQSVVLSTDESLIGAAINPGCSNSSADACEGDNNKCTNYGSAGKHGYNMECKNSNKPNPGDLTPGQTQIGNAEKP